MNPKLDLITVTLNPAIDQTVFVDELRPGEVHRVRESRRSAGGKGINVATMLALGGVGAVTVTGMLGDENARVFEQHFQAHGLEDAFVRVAGETRTGIKIVDTSAGTTTDLNFAGFRPGEDELNALAELLADKVSRGTWVVFAGSLPPGIDSADLAGWIRNLRAAGARIAVDTSGPALAAAVEAGVDLAKPNEHELEELVGRQLDSSESLLAAARELQSTQIPQLIVSLGGEGALFLTSEATVRASPPPVEVVSTVGAGDSLLAGYLQGLLEQWKLADRARLASVYAWSRLESLDPTLPRGESLMERLGRISVEAV